MTPRMLCWFLLSLACTFKPAMADSTYQSIANAIENAEAQAYIYLDRGIYVSRTQDVDVTWTIPGDTVALVSFRYVEGILQSAIIDFKKTPTYAVFRTSDGTCTRFRLAKVIVGPGGYIDPTSDIRIQPGGNCSQRHSGFQNNVGAIFGLQPIARNLFRGKPFAASKFCKQGEISCINGKAENPNGDPVSRVTFFTSLDKNNKPIIEAFLVSLTPDQQISLPNGNFITIGDGSLIRMSYVDYDTRQKAGLAMLEKISVNAKGGNLIFGNTVLALAPATHVAFEHMSVKESAGNIEMTDGSISGALGDGSIVQIDSSNGRKSSISIQSAEVELHGVAITYRGSSGQLAGSSGTFALITKGSQFEFSDNAKVNLQSANLRLALGCENGAPPGCIPFAWGTDGRVVIKGAIAAATVKLAPGGYIAFPNQNRLTIDSGDMLTDVLRIDTADQTTPITGGLQNVNLQLSAQDWNLDKSTKLKLGVFSLSSQNIAIIKGDKSPVGEMKFKAILTDLTASGLGSVRFVNGTGSIDLMVRRELGSDPKIEGDLGGTFVAQADAPESSAAASLRLHDIKYQSGYGTAKLDFSVDSANAIYRTPAEQREEGVPGGKFSINAYSVPIGFALTAPIALKDVDVSVDGATWSAPNITDVPISIKMAIPGMLAAHAQHYLGQGDVVVADSCKPEVNTIGADYIISGKLDMKFAGKNREIATKDFSINAPIQANLDPSDCKAVAFISCGILGSIVNPVLGVAAALACGKAVQDAQNKFQDDLRDKSYEYVGKLNFSSPIK